MKDKSLAERLIYLDTEFISRLYESEFDVSPETRITRTEGLQASVSLALFSGGGNSSESKTYSISTLEMLDVLEDRLNKYPISPTIDYSMDLPSLYCWVDGTLGISSVKVTKRKHTITLIGKPNPEKNKGSEEFVGEETFFKIKSDAAHFALSPIDQYFVSGIAAFKGLTHLVIDTLSMPCRALIRVFSAKTSFGEWIATPLVIYDPDNS